MQMQPFRLLRFRNSDRVGAPPFPLGRLSQNGPRCQGFAAPRRNGAPLTAPGRSEEPYLIRRERRIGKSMTLTAQHLATFNRRDHVRATKPRGTCTAAGGWMPKISRRPARGRDCSLDIPFYRTGRLDTLPRTERFAKLEWPAAGMTLRLASALVTRSHCLLFQFRRIEAFSFLPDR